jgi:dihydrofolate synthase/folylpolyglutamate synthase
MPVLRPPDILLDVAHNPDKVRALVSSLPSVLGGLEGQASPPVLLTGALSNKDARAMMEQLVPLVSTVVTTAVGVTGKEPLSAAAMADAVRLAGFEGAVVAEPEPTQALGTAIRLARERGASVIGTGSLYVAGRLREHWYPARHILRQQTPWPAGTDLVLR